jgi:tetratricopeptide (TPR) repeat protein
VIELNPNFADAYFFRGVARGGTENDKEAIEDFNKCIQLNPNHDQALSYRGSAKFLSGNKKGACSDWKKAMELGNDDAENSYNSYCVE